MATVQVTNDVPLVCDPQQRSNASQQSAQDTAQMFYLHRASGASCSRQVLCTLKAAFEVTLRASELQVKAAVAVASTADPIVRQKECSRRLGSSFRRSLLLRLLCDLYIFRH